MYSASFEGSGQVLALPVSPTPDIVPSPKWAPSEGPSLTLLICDTLVCKVPYLLQLGQQRADGPFAGITSLKLGVIGLTGDGYKMHYVVCIAFLKNVILGF